MNQKIILEKGVIMKLYETYKSILEAIDSNTNKTTPKGWLDSDWDYACKLAEDDWNSIMSNLKSTSKYLSKTYSDVKFDITKSGYCYSGAPSFFGRTVLFKYKNNNWLPFISQ